MSGFFHVVSRYARPALAEQWENRLTQVFAGVLEHSEGLALELARHWLAVDPTDGREQLDAQSPDVAASLGEEGLLLRNVRTQRPTHGGKVVDLELRFGHRDATSADDIVIWIEVKDGASPHEHQLSNYLRDIIPLDVRASAVVLLAPRQSYPFTRPEPPPPKVRQRRWQRTAARCAGWARRADGVPQFLVAEFLDYLQEENLMDPEALTPVHLVALAEYQRALDGIETICEVASGVIEHDWNTRTNCKMSHGKPDFGLGYYELHPTAAAGEDEVDWGPVWWDWVLRGADLGIEDSRGGVPVFTAGLTAELPGAIVTPATTAWATKLADSNSHRFVEFADSYNRFSRVAYPEEVLVGRTLQQQGESLGKWVVASYKALYEAGPPREL